jgi:hypothetical protein
MGTQEQRAFGELLTICLRCRKGKPASAFTRNVKKFRECSDHCIPCQKALEQEGWQAAEDEMAKQRKERDMQRMVDAILGVQQGVPSASEIVAKLMEKFGGAEGFARDYFDDFTKFRNRHDVSPRLVLDTYARLMGMVQTANQHNLQAARLLSDEQLEKELAETLKIYTGEEPAPEIKTA